MNQFIQNYQQERYKGLRTGYAQQLPGPYQPTITYMSNTAPSFTFTASDLVKGTTINA